MAQKFLYEGKHEEAIPAALHSLRFSISIYGSNSVKLVPAYLILAEASTGKFSAETKSIDDKYRTVNLETESK